MWFWFWHLLCFCYNLGSMFLWPLQSSDTPMYIYVDLCFPPNNWLHIDDYIVLFGISYLFEFSNIPKSGLKNFSPILAQSNINP